MTVLPKCCSIVSLFYRILVRSNEDTVEFLSQGSDTFRSVEQMFEIGDRNR